MRCFQLAQNQPANEDAVAVGGAISICFGIINRLRSMNITFLIMIYFAFHPRNAFSIDLYIIRINSLLIHG